MTADEANARRAEALKICATVNKIKNLRETGKATRRFGKSQSSRANQPIAACVALWRPGKEGGIWLWAVWGLCGRRMTRTFRVGNLQWEKHTVNGLRGGFGRKIR